MFLEEHVTPVTRFSAVLVRYPEDFLDLAKGGKPFLQFIIIWQRIHPDFTILSGWLQNWPLRHGQLVQVHHHKHWLVGGTVFPVVVAFL